MAGTKLYKAWKSMRERCRNPKQKSYPDYGGRGIKIAPRWDHFPNFLTDMGDLPGPGYTLERINNEADYEPGNCVWIERRLQSRNTRRNVYLTIDGERRTVAEWARFTGVNLQTLWTRLYAGWPPQEAVLPRKFKSRFERYVK